MHAQVFRFGVFAFGLGGIELTLTTLGAVDLELRGHLTQRLGSLIVATAQRVRPADRIVERGGDGVRRATRQLGAQFGDESNRPPRLFTVGLRFDRELVIGRRRPLQGQPLACGRQFGLRGAQLPAGDLGASRPAPPASSPRLLPPCDASRSPLSPVCVRPPRRRGPRGRRLDRRPRYPMGPARRARRRAVQPGAFAIRRRRQSPTSASNVAFSLSREAIS